MLAAWIPMAETRSSPSKIRATTAVLRASASPRLIPYIILQANSRGKLSHKKGVIPAAPARKLPDISSFFMLIFTASQPDINENTIAVSAGPAISICTRLISTAG